MTLDGLLTFLSLMVAAYALTSQTTRMRLSLMWGWPAFTGITALIAVLYLQFFDLVGQTCPSGFGDACTLFQIEDYGLEPTRLSFLVVLVTIATMWLLLRRKRVSPRGLPALANLLSGLIREKQFSEAAALVRPNLTLIEKGIDANLLWTRLHHQIRRIDPRLRPPWQWMNETPIREPMKRPTIRMIANLRHVFPSGRRSKDAATSICSEIANSQGFVQHLTMQHLDMAVRLLTIGSWQSEVYAESFLVGLLDHPESPLYREKGVTTPPSHATHRYDKSMPLHAGLFNNAEQAKNLGIWKPVGDYIIRRLTPGSDPDYITYLNSPPVEIHRDVKTDPLDTVIEFFDVMVRAAAFQGVRDHMWLFYFPIILREILKSYDASAPNVNQTDEWAIRADYSIYRLFDVLIDWAALPMRLPAGSPHLQTEAGVQPDGQNIPKSAELCLGDCFAQLLACGQVRDALKSYIAQMLFRQMRDIERSDCANPFYLVLKRSVIERGGFRTDPEHGAHLKTVFASIDHVISSDLEDFRDDMDAAYP